MQITWSTRCSPRTLEGYARLKVSIVDDRQQQMTMDVTDGLLIESKAPHMTPRLDINHTLCNLEDTLETALISTVARG